MWKFATSVKQWNYFIPIFTVIYVCIYLNLDRSTISKVE
jgi:hypothetical protein